MADPRIIVIGGGLAGLMAAIRAAENGAKVQLFSMVPVKRSHSVCAQGGINGAVNTKGEGDSPWQHFDDSIYGGDFLANQPPVKAMCDAAPGIIYLLDRMGVMFNRTPEGLLDFRRFGGTRHHRTAHAGATTGQQLMYALDEQVRRFEVSEKIQKFEGWEYLSAVLDDKPVCRGMVAIDLASMEVRAFEADAVIICTGGPGRIFGQGTNSTICTGAAAASAYLQGAYYANGEFVQVHPTAVPGEDKHRLISESVRGEGGRVWVPKDGKPWYFLEEWYPAYGNLVPRDVATRAIYKIVHELGLGVDGQPQVYLDVSHLDPKFLNVKLGGVLEIYEKFIGDDPRKVPMRIFPAYHYSMGGLWVDYDHMTNIAGLFAAGEVDYQYHGANRLGANSLLSCIFSGQVVGNSTVKYAKGIAPAKDPRLLLESERQRQQEALDQLLKAHGRENVYELNEEMAQWMSAHVSVIRYNQKLKETDQKLQELTERSQNLSVQDASGWTNQDVLYAYQLKTILPLARVIALGALARNESRGAHYKPDFPDRNDSDFLKTTVAKYSPGKDEPELFYEEVDTSLLKPRPRKYDTVSSAGGNSGKSSNSGEKTVKEKPTQEHSSQIGA